MYCNPAKLKVKKKKKRMVFSTVTESRPLFKGTHFTSPLCGLITRWMHEINSWDSENVQPGGLCYKCIT